MAKRSRPPAKKPADPIISLAIAPRIVQRLRALNYRASDSAIQGKRLSQVVAEFAGAAVSTRALVERHLRDELAKIARDAGVPPGTT